VGRHVYLWTVSINKNTGVGIVQSRHHHRLTARCDRTQLDATQKSLIRSFNIMYGSMW